MYNFKDSSVGGPRTIMKNEIFNFVQFLYTIEVKKHS